MSRTGFHAGERSVQDRAGVRGEADRLAGMLASPDLDGAVGAFIAERDAVFVTSRDGDGTLWTSVIAGAPGCCSAGGGALAVAGVPEPGDPLDELRPGEAIGMLFVDFSRRRRVRVNGTLGPVGPEGFVVAVDQAYGNCPKYIARRELRLAEPGGAGGPRSVRRATGLDAAAAAVLEGADTAVLGTAHPEHGADTSHRGGARGFLRVDRDDPDRSVWWADLPGNNLFNSLGNIVVDPVASLLVMDVAAGLTVQVTGHATVEWEPADGGTGRRVRLRPSRVVVTTGPPGSFRDLDRRVESRSG